MIAVNIIISIILTISSIIQFGEVTRSRPANKATIISASIGTIQLVLLFLIWFLST